MSTVLRRVFVLFFAFILGVKGYPYGAPARVCSTMTPHHRNTTPQAGASPFLVKAIPLHGGSVQVSVEIGDEDTRFKGFLLRAFNTDGSVIGGGTFTNFSSNVHIIDCPDNGNALTHSNRSEKEKITASWTPPPGFSGVVIFNATVVQQYEKYWTGVQSKGVRVTSVESSTKVPVTTSQALNVYSQCGSTKGCFGLPNNCVEKQGCEIILTFQAINNSVRFELTGALGSQTGWIAMALSHDSKMGQDSVTECLYQSGVPSLQESWNVDKPRKNNVFLPEESKTIYDLEVEYDDGIITCRWSRPISTVVNGQDFDLRNNEIYILLAKGLIDGNGNKIVHTTQLASAYPVNLTSIILVAGKTTVLLKVHGSFMTVAWICLVSLSILLARHYKEVWLKYKMCNTKVWFAVHRCFMLLSVALVIAGFAAIFVHVDGWSSIGMNPHAIIGCVVTGLAVIQPIIAIFRPQPTSPKRPIFNWVHTLIGNAAQITAVANMFFAVSLKSSNLPQAFYWVLVTFIIFHCLVHLLIHIHSCFMEREREMETNPKSDQFRCGDGYDINQDAPGSSFKKFALGLYSFVNVGLTTALVLMICLN